MLLLCVELPHPLSFGVRCCPGLWRRALAPDSSHWSSSWWPCWDLPQSRPRLLETGLCLWQQEPWKDWGTPCPSSWLSDCREQAMRRRKYDHFNGFSSTVMCKKMSFVLLRCCLKLNLSNSALMWKQILPQLKRKMGNVLQRKEPCPHTNIVEHSVGQASSRKLQASMHGKQSDSARLKRKSRDLTLCKKWTQIVQNKSPSYSMLCLTHESRSKETHC